MSDRFTPINDAGGWWFLYRNYDGTTGEPDGYCLTVKRADHMNNQFRGRKLDPLIDRAVEWCEQSGPALVDPNPPKVKPPEPAPERARKRKKLKT